jgi:hypothetical protein
MGSAKDSRFAKLRSCPSSFALLFHRDAGLLPPELASHLAACDFCSAELYFLSRQQLVLGEHIPAEMPLHLRALANAVLRAEHPYIGASDFLKSGGHLKDDS